MRVPGAPATPPHPQQAPAQVDVEPLQPPGGVAAPLPSSGADAAKEECERQLRANAVDEAPLTKGAGLCVETGDGRVAFARTLSSLVPPDEIEGRIRPALTVWDQEH